MTRIGFIVLLILIGLPLQSYTQKSSCSDIQGNKYTWTEYELIKSDSETKLEIKWQNPAGGKISWVDVSDPFRILVFSQISNQIIWLNNKLSSLGDPVNLSDQDIHEPLGLGLAKDGGIWILDAASNKLYKMDKRFDIQIESPIRLFESQDKDTWIQIIEWKQYLAILTPGNSLWIADLFGQILKRLPTKARELHFSPDGLILISSEEKTMYLPESGQMISLIKKPH